MERALRYLNEQKSKSLFGMYGVELGLEDLLKLLEKDSKEYNSVKDELFQIRKIILLLEEQY